VANKLPARPNLDHLRKQAKTLLADLKRGTPSAAKSFIAHLPAAKKMSPARVRAAGFRLADAQSVVARSAGFDSWTDVVRHVEQLKGLEGEWRFVALQVDGADMPAGALTESRLLIDGDRFRMESPEGAYDGHFTIDAAAEPMRIDINFVEGPEAGNSSEGIFEITGDQLTMCIGVVGASRPKSFSTRPGSGHALERLRRASAERQRRVTGGTPQSESQSQPAAPAVDVKAFDVEMTPLLRRLEGEWAAVALVRDGIVTREDWLPFGSRIGAGNETKVVFGGQVMVHAKVRIDERTTPMTIDYLNLAGAQKGRISLGIIEWVGARNEEVRFLIAVPGQPRPSGFDVPAARGLTLSQWRRK